MGPQLLGYRPGLCPVRNWEASGRWASKTSSVFTTTPITHITSWAPPPVGSAAALDSHRSMNPTVNCACERSRFLAPYENHPQTILSPPPHHPWKNCLLRGLKGWRALHHVIKEVLATAKKKKKNDPQVQRFKQSRNFIFLSCSDWNSRFAVQLQAVFYSSSHLVSPPVRSWHSLHTRQSECC